jgi:hypothetical protein
MATMVSPRWGLAQNRAGKEVILTLSNLWLESMSRRGCSGGSSLYAKTSSGSVPWWFSGDIDDTYGVVVPVEALGGVGLARVAKNRCGSERGRGQELEDPFW